MRPYNGASFSTGYKRHLREQVWRLCAPYLSIFFNAAPYLYLTSAKLSIIFNKFRVIKHKTSCL